MGFSEQVDAPGGSHWRRLICLALLLASASPAVAAGSPTEEQIAAIKVLYDGKRWQEVVDATRQVPAAPGDFGLYRGLALSHLQRWDEARQAFAASLATNPGDARLMVELGGLAYRQKNFAEAKRYLQRALASNGPTTPDDRYATNLLASIYFLDGNLEAALKYWNRIGKLQLSDLRFEPQPPLKPALLDHAFAFQRGSVWSREQYLATRDRLSHLDVFETERYDLEANADDSFDLVFTGVPKPRWQDSPWTAGASLLSGLPYLTVYPEFPNIDGGATNWNSTLRWDDQKRRYMSSVSGPLKNNPAWGYRASLDVRNENWNLSNTLLPSASPSPAAVNFQRESVATQFASVANDGWNWTLGPAFTYRNFRNAIGLPAAAAPFFTTGANLALQGSASRSLLRYPERRLTVNGAVTGEAGTFFAAPLGRYAKLDGDLNAHWLPQARGDDYETDIRLRSGGTAGNVPLDELYILGFDRDTDLWMRGHPGLLNGQKGNAPLGREYVLLNYEIDKIAYRAPLVTFRVGPFLDSGKVFDPSPYFGTPQWMWDTGAQLKIRVLGSFEFVLGYGKDLRSGRNSFFTTVLPQRVE